VLIFAGWKAFGGCGIVLEHHNQPRQGIEGLMRGFDGGVGAPSAVAPPFRITEVLGKQNPTPKPTDEKGNPKHWVKKRIEVGLVMRG
jgi:hypothetical protein